MTALQEYDRLESLGLWKQNHDAQRQEVVVSFGDSSLVLRDNNDRPVTHWSMAAIERVNPNARPAIYSVDASDGETLEIDDKTMVKAIERVRARIQRGRPKPGRLRVWMSMSIFAICIVAGIMWLPDATSRYAMRVVPEASVNDIARASIAQVNHLTGKACSTRYGERALRQLEQRLIGAPSNKILIVDMGNRKSASLPGGYILINKTLLADHDSPEVLAGYVLMERAAQDEQPTLFHLFRAIGMKKTLKFLITGDIETDKLAKFSEDRIRIPATPPAADTVQELFNIAELSNKQFIQTAPRYATLADRDNYALGYTPLLSDEDWISLQEICN